VPDSSAEARAPLVASQTVLPAQTTPQSDGTVNAAVKDVFGAPVDGALVTLYSVHGSSHAITGASGSVTFVRVAPGFISLSAYDESVGAAGASSSVRLQTNGHVEVAITVQPSANPAMRVGAAPTNTNANGGF
jgi:hypothetical protein